MDNVRLTYLFRRYVHNSCTEAEKAEFLAFANDARNAEQLKALMDILWSEISVKKLAPDQSERIISAILGSNAINRRLIRESHFPWVGIAASLVLVLLFGSGFFFYYFSSSRQAVYSGKQVSVPTPTPRFVKLADGSSVVLNEGSKLRFPASFDGDIREVSLIGEGYFDIAHDPYRPFVVHTGKLKTTVLGTAFNIKAYPDQSDITVTVTRGKVEVSDDKKVLGIISPDEQITFNTAREFSEQKYIDSHSVVSWIERDIFFDDQTMGQALEQLEKRFGITIALSNPDISGCRFTATFVKGEDIEQILRILCDFNNARLLVQGPGSYTIEGGKCPL